MTGAWLAGMKVGWSPMSIPQAHSRWEVLISGPISSPKRFELAKMRLDIGAAVSTCPLNFGPDGSGGGRFYRTARGECIRDGGACHFQAHYESGLWRSLNGRLMGVHKVLCSTGVIACDGHQEFYLGSDGGFMILVHRKKGLEMRINFER